jgi:S1-C subfamily serine protease
MEKWRTMMRASYLIVALAGVFAVTGVAAGQSPAAVQMPTGWLGVMLSDEGTFDERGTAFFEGYPVVSEVEPESPAAKAGVRPGDILMSFNSHDMRGGIVQLHHWLKPGAAFKLQLRRNDGVRVVEGVLGRPPVGWRRRVDLALKPSQAFEQRAQSPSRPPIVLDQRVRVTAPSPTRVPPALIPAFTFGAGVYPFAGMEFTALNDDIAEVLRVKREGVFVANVVEETPARIAGLKGGDVLLYADDLKLETPLDLVDAIAEAEDRTLRLRIVRNRKPQTLTLRW